MKVRITSYINDEPVVIGRNVLHEGETIFVDDNLGRFLIDNNVAQEVELKAKISVGEFSLNEIIEHLDRSKPLPAQVISVLDEFHRRFRNRNDQGEKP